MTTLLSVRQNITAFEKKYHRQHGSVSLLAVSKKQSVQKILSLVNQGQRDFGENQLQEALPKIEVLSEHVLTWHFIGPVQSNKTADIARHFDWVHSIDRLKIAERLNQQRSSAQKPLQVCIQVNVSGESSKSGVMESEVSQLANKIVQLPHLQLRGLMTIPKPTILFEEQRAQFQRLVELQNHLCGQGFCLDTLSMGMSDDYEAAIAEGATLIRLGTALFGER